MLTQGKGIVQEGSNLELRPVTLDLTCLVMIFLLWMLIGSDWTRSGGASGRLCSASGLGVQAARARGREHYGGTSGRSCAASGHYLSVAWA